MTESDLDQYMIARGFFCLRSNGNKHWQYRRDDLVINGWPTTTDDQGKMKWMVFGKVFYATEEGLLGLFDAGRLIMPGDASPATCRGCGGDIYWIVNHNQKRVPLDSNGEAHHITCPEASAFRR